MGQKCSNYKSTTGERETETPHLKSGNFLFDFLEAEDLHGEGVTVSVMWMGGVKTALVGGRGLRVEKEDVLDTSLLLLLLYHCWEQTVTVSPVVSGLHLPRKATRDGRGDKLRVWQFLETANLVPSFLVCPLTGFLKLSRSLSREGGWRLDFWASWALAIWALESRRTVSGTGIYQCGPETNGSFWLVRSTFCF